MPPVHHASGAYTQQPNPIAEIHDDFIKARLSLANTKLEIADTEARVKALQSEIVRLQDLEQYYGREVETKGHVLRSKCFIDRVPVEALYEMFLYIVDDPFYARRSPWRLAVVSKRWRKICLGKPRLWSNFDIKARHRCGEKQERGVLVAQAIGTTLQLDRSRNALLFIRLGTICQCSSQRSIFELLIAHTSRWASVEFDLRNMAQLRALQDLTPPFMDLSSLREIIWANLSDGSGDDDIQDTAMSKIPFVNHTTLPSLHTVSFKYVATISTSPESFPWAQITSLSLLPFSGRLYDLLSTLSNCPNLKVLELSFHGRKLLEALESDTPLNGNVITLPRLVKATIFDLPNASYNIITNLFLHLQLPLLTSLAVANIRLFLPIGDLVDRSCRNSLTHLTIGAYLTHGTIVATTELLRLCPKLESFAFYNIHEPETKSTKANQINTDAHVVILGLILPEEGEGICPLLRTLRFFRFKVDPVLIMRMIDSRINASSKAIPTARCLEALTITFPSSTAAATIPKLNAQLEPHPDLAFCRSLLEEKYKQSKISLEIRVSWKSDVMLFDW